MTRRSDQKNYQRTKALHKNNNQWLGYGIGAIGKQCLLIVGDMSGPLAKPVALSRVERPILNPTDKRDGQVHMRDNELLKSVNG